MLKRSGMRFSARSYSETRRSKAVLCMTIWPGVKTYSGGSVNYNKVFIKVEKVKTEISRTEVLVEDMV